MDRAMRHYRPIGEPVRPDQGCLIGPPENHIYISTRGVWSRRRLHDGSEALDEAANRLEKSLWSKIARRHPAAEGRTVSRREGRVENYSGQPAHHRPRCYSHNFFSAPNFSAGMTFQPKSLTCLLPTAQAGTLDSSAESGWAANDQA